MKFPPAQTAFLVARNDCLAVGESASGIANGLVNGDFEKRPFCPRTSLGLLWSKRLPPFELPRTDGANSPTIHLTVSKLHGDHELSGSRSRAGKMCVRSVQWFGNAATSRACPETPSSNSAFDRANLTEP